jgi:tripartite-type tricarboxylate transporter receptor subunit TctC
MSSVNRRAILGASIGLSVAAASLSRPAIAQSWPTRPVRLIVPYAAGGPSDVIARAVQNSLQATLGQPIVVENRPGGGAMIGTETAARSTDEHTFLIADSPHTIIPAVQSRVPYDPVKDFQPVTLLGAVSMILAVHPNFPAQDVKGFLAKAKEKSENVTFGSSGVGSLTHLLPEWLGILTSTSLTTVPYRGSGPALMDVVSGTINAIFTSTLSASGPLKDKQVRPIAVAAVSRIGALPDVPTLRESGIDMVSSNWWGVLALKSTPPAVVERMNKALQTAMDDQAVRDRFAALGIEARPRGPAPFGELLTAEFANWARVAQQAGVKVTAQ